MDVRKCTSIVPGKVYFAIFILTPQKCCVKVKRRVEWLPGVWRVALLLVFFVTFQWSGLAWPGLVWSGLVWSVTRIYGPASHGPHHSQWKRKRGRSRGGGGRATSMAFVWPGNSRPGDEPHGREKNTNQVLNERLFCIYSVMHAIQGRRVCWMDARGFLWETSITRASSTTYLVYRFFSCYLACLYSSIWAEHTRKESSVWGGGGGKRRGIIERWNGVASPGWHAIYRWWWIEGDFLYGFMNHE